MLCERCKKKPATVHLTEVIKDIRSEIHICEECAREIGLNSKLTGFSLSISEMLTFLESGEGSTGTGDNRCPRCGTTFSDYRKDEKIGCPECYFYIIDSLKPILSGMHGDRKHTGKKPLLYGIIQDETRYEKDIPGDDIITTSTESLEDQLRKAVQEERYEEAARLRDRIRCISLEKNS